MKKTISLVTTLFLATLFFTSCAAKVPPSYDLFIEQAIKAEYRVEPEEFSDGTGRGLIALKGETNIMFLEYEEDSEALKSFSELSQVVETLSTGSGTTTTTSSNGPTWANQSLTIDDMFYRVSYIKNTVVVVESSKEEKQEVNVFLKSLGF